jgi:hypothetical protein
MVLLIVVSDVATQAVDTEPTAEMMVAGVVPSVQERDGVLGEAKRKGRLERLGA